MKHINLIASGLILCLSCTAMILTAFVHITQDVPIGMLTRDPAAVAGVSVYTGFLSQVGSLLWASASSVCVLSALACAAIRGKHDLFLWASAGLSLILGVDDTFMLHDAILPFLGVPELLVFGTYAASMLGYLVCFRGRLPQLTSLWLVGALGCFAISMGIDMINPSLENIFLYEDGAKFIGITLWSVHFFQVCVRELRRAAQEHSLNERGHVAV